ncbi:MAG: hypothetical protein JKY48_18790 [Flavobacteriales bacterium]|nr:hypothetical protein [Flavobacteriales bacterium]
MKVEAEVSLGLKIFKHDLVLSYITKDSRYEGELALNSEKKGGMCFKTKFSSKVFEFSIDTTDLRMLIDYTPLENNDFEFNCRIFKTNKFSGVNDLINLLKKTLGQFTGDDAGLFTELLDFTAKNASHVISFSKDGVTIGDTVTVDCNSIDLTIERKSKKIKLVKLKLSEAKLRLNSIKGIDLSPLGIDESNVEIKGSVKIDFTNNKKSISFEVKESGELKPFGLSIPLVKEEINVKLAFLSFEIKKDSGKHKKYTIIGSGSVGLSGGPSYLESILPKNAQFTLAMNSSGVDLTIPTLFTDKKNSLLSIPMPVGKALKLGDLFIDLTGLTLSLGKETGVSVTTKLGLPIELNAYLKSMKLPEFLNTGKDAKFGCKLELDAKKGLEVTLIGSPIKTGAIGEIISITEKKGKDSKTGNDTFGWEIEFGPKGDYGIIQIDKLAFSKGADSTALSAAGHFKILKPLAIPLGFIQTILVAVGLLDDKCGECKECKAGETCKNRKSILPDKVTLKEIKLLDDLDKLDLTEVKTFFATKEVKNIAKEFIKVFPKPAIKALKELIPGVINSKNELNIAKIADKASTEVEEKLNTFIDIFPPEFKKYLKFSFPSEISFNIDIGADGSVNGNIEVPEDSDPIRLLCLTGIDLFGIQLRKLSIGNIPSITSAAVDVDMVVNYFNLLEIGAARVLSTGGIFPVTKSEKLTSTVELKNLFTLIYYGAGIPIPLPIFYDEIGLHYKSITGFNAKSSFKFPKPKFDILQVVKASKELVNYLKYGNEYLSESNVGKPDLNLTVGANYIELPSYLGGKILGKTTEIGSFGAWKPVSKMLNFIKKSNVNDLVELVPLQYRIGKESIDFLDILKIEVQWLIVSVNEVKNNGLVQSLLLNKGNKITNEKAKEALQLIEDKESAQKSIAKILEILVEVEKNRSGIS